MALLKGTRVAIAMAAPLGAIVVACTLTHPLDDIHATFDASARDAGVDADAAVDAMDACADGPIPWYCMDGRQDNDETDVDCGGSCYPCAIGRTCTKDADCSTSHCDAQPDAGDAATNGRCRCPSDMVQGDRPAGGLHGEGFFCIDKLETVVGDYLAFTMQCDKSCRATAFQALLHNRCDSNASPGPDTTNGSCAGYATTNAMLPVACVNWCSAYAYCAWRGKRLCNDFGDAPTPISLWANAARDEWFNACSFNGTIDVPYGVYDKNACNGERDGGVVAANTAFPNCTSAYSSALFDLSGNVYEWEDSCNDNPNDDTCHARGGAFYSPEPELHCSGFGAFPRATVDVGIGFRCCLGY